MVKEKLKELNVTVKVNVEVISQTVYLNLYKIRTKDLLSMSFF